MNMIKKIFSPLLFCKPVSFDYHGSIDGGIRALSKHVKRTVFNAFLQDALIGEVTHSKVRIWHSNFSTGTSGVLPVFVGRFVSIDGKTKLIGEFKLHELSKFCYIFLIPGMIAFWVFVFVYVLNETPTSKLLSTLYIPIATIIFPILFLYFGWKHDKKDITYIEENIRKFLNI